MGLLACKAAPSTTVRHKISPGELTAIQQEVQGSSIPPLGPVSKQENHKGLVEMKRGKPLGTVMFPGPAESIAWRGAGTRKAQGGGFEDF